MLVNNKKLVRIYVAIKAYFNCSVEFEFFFTLPLFLCRISNPFSSMNPSQTRPYDSLYCIILVPYFVIIISDFGHFLFINYNFHGVVPLVIQQSESQYEEQL